MIEHYVPLKLTHEEMTLLRDKFNQLVVLQTQERIEGRAQSELFELEDWFGGLDWLVMRVVHATEAS